MVDPISILIISFIGFIALAAFVAIPALLIFGIAVSVVKFFAPALVALALGLGIGFGIGKMQEKSPNPASVELHIDATQKAKPKIVALPVTIKK